MTIRDESTRTLADALGYGDPVVAAEMATGILAASPTLAADLDLATAWRMAQAECERLGWTLVLETNTFSGASAAAEAWDPHWPDRDNPPQPRYRYEGDPTEALVALTSALRERAR